MLIIRQRSVSCCNGVLSVEVAEFDRFLHTPPHPHLSCDYRPNRHVAAHIPCPPLHAVASITTTVQSRPSITTAQRIAACIIECSYVDGWDYRFIHVKPCRSWGETRW